MEARVLLSDFTGGEVSPRVDARSDLKKYGSALRKSENFILSQQGGAVLRLGSQYLGEALSSGASPVPDVRLIPWRSGDPSQKEILFEITGNTVRGWQDGALILSGGVPYQLTLPVSVSGEIQATQRGKLLAITGAAHPPFIVRVNGVSDWELILIPTTLYPRRSFDIGGSPPTQGTVYDVTFVGFNAGNTYKVLVDGFSVKFTANVPGATGSLSGAALGIYSATTATNVTRLKALISGSSLIKDPATDVAVSYISGTTYRVTLSGGAAGRELVVSTTTESATLRIEVETNVTGRDGSEAAWSYPTVVTYSGVYYQCITPHVSAASPLPNADATNWLPLAGAPPWEAAQPSEAWSNASISYGLGNRGFPRSCAFHEQRLIVGGTPTAPQTFWGSAIGDPLAFLGGVEDNEPLSRDIDATDAPGIRWMTSQQGLLIGTSAGVWQATGQITLTPADVNITPFSADRSSAIQPQVVGNEVLFVSQDRTQLLSFRRNEQVGPYEVADLTALAEHLGRQRIRRVVYCRQPQPVVYVLTDQPGLLLAITYNRQYDMVGFSRLTMDANIDDIGSLFDETNGDELYLLVRRTDRSSVEKITHPSSMTPVDNPPLNATVHLDGWVTRTDTAGTVSGLRHLLGKTVNVLNSDGTVQKTATVALGGTPVESPVTITNPGFEAGDPDGAGTNGWKILSVPVAGVPSAYEGSRGVRLRVGAFYESSIAAMESDLITVVAGRQYRLTLRYQLSEDMDFFSGEVATVSQLRWYSDTGGTVFLSSAVSQTVTAAADWTLWTQIAIAPVGAVRVRIGVSMLSPSRTFELYVDDYQLFETTQVDGVITATGTNLIVGQGFTGTLKPMEPEMVTRSGSIIGTKKKFDELSVRLYQSALPKVNGARPSDYEQAGGAYRANPQSLRSGDYDVNTQGWDDGTIEITQDLPHRTEITGVYGPIKVNR